MNIDDQGGQYSRPTGTGLFLKAYPPTLLSIFPPLFSKIARAFDLRLIFSGSGRRTATTVRVPCSGFLTGVLTRDKSCPMTPLTLPRWRDPIIAPMMMPTTTPARVPHNNGIVL